MSFRQTTHELHQRRFGRNVGVALALAALIAVFFGLTVAKVGTSGSYEAFDHVLRPQMVPAGEDG